MSEPPYAQAVANPMQTFEYEIEPACQKLRLDVYLAEVQEEISRSFIRKLIDSKRVQVNGIPGKAGYKLKVGDHIHFEIPDPVPLELEPEDIPLNIIYEDAHLLVIDKPAGMVVHPSPGHSQGTLVNALLHHCGEQLAIGGVERPGIVHRLDKDTSGLIVVAKTDSAFQGLSHQFKSREIKKEYLAIVHGHLKEKSGVMDFPIGRHRVHRKKMAAIAQGRSAETRYQVLKEFENYSLVQAFPKTGRTHQIRVHFSNLGHAILGDPLYGRGLPRSLSNTISRQALHASRLTLTHPETGKLLQFMAKLPSDMEKLTKTTNFHP